MEVGKGGGAMAEEVMDGTGSGRKDLTSSFHMATKTADNGQCNGGRRDGQGRQRPIRQRGHDRNRRR